MAQNLGTSVYTLGLFRSNVRLQCQALNPQESGLIDPQLTDIIHNAVLLVRNLMGRLVDEFYETDAALTVGSVTSSKATASLATYSVYDPKSIRLFDATLKIIPVLSPSDFLAIKQYYSSLSATQAIAVLMSVAGTPNVFGLEFFTGAASIAATTIYYARNPVKVTADADTVDLPDNLMPIAQDIATVAVFRKVSKTPPAEIDARAMAFINSQLQQLSIPAGNKN